MNSRATGSRTQEHRITIEAPAEAIWKALIDAEEVVRWIASVAEIDPREGGRYFLSWGEGMDGEARIVKLEPRARLGIVKLMGKENAFLTREMIDALDPDSPLMDEFILETAGGITTLRLVTSGIPAVESWDGFYEGTDAGWTFYLYALKHYLENHRGTPRQTVEIMQPVSGTREQVWKALTGPAGLAAKGSVAGVREGGRYAAITVGGDRLEGEVVRSAPPVALTLTVDNLNNALFSVGVQDREAAGTGLWMALYAYGLPREEVDALRGRWSRMVEGLGIGK